MSCMSHINTLSIVTNLPSNTITIYHNQFNHNQLLIIQSKNQYITIIITDQQVLSYILFLHYQAICQPTLFLQTLEGPQTTTENKTFNFKQHFDRFNKRWQKCTNSFLKLKLKQTTCQKSITLQVEVPPIFYLRHALALVWGAVAQVVEWSLDKTLNLEDVQKTLASEVALASAPWMLIPSTVKIGEGCARKGIKRKNLCQIYLQTMICCGNRHGRSCKEKKVYCTCSSLKVILSTTELHKEN